MDTPGLGYYYNKQMEMYTRYGDLRSAIHTHYISAFLIYLLITFLVREVCPRKISIF